MGERIQVRGSPSRCAYCHDDLSTAKTACHACLAPHHPECWEDKCAACGASQRLVAESKQEEEEEEHPQEGRVFFGPLTSFLLVLLGIGLGLLTMASAIYMLGPMEPPVYGWLFVGGSAWAWLTYLLWLFRRR